MPSSSKVLHPHFEVRNPRWQSTQAQATVGIKQRIIQYDTFGPLLLAGPAEAVPARATSFHDHTP